MLRRFSCSKARTLREKCRTSWLVEVEVINGLSQEREKGSLRNMGWSSRSGAGFRARVAKSAVICCCLALADAACVTT